MRCHVDTHSHTDRPTGVIAKQACLASCKHGQTSCQSSAWQIWHHAVCRLQGNLPDECAGILWDEWSVPDALLLLRWVEAAAGMTAITRAILQPLYTELDRLALEERPLLATWLLAGNQTPL